MIVSTSASVMVSRIPQWTMYGCRRRRRLSNGRALSLEGLRARHRKPRHALRARSHRLTPNLPRRGTNMRHNSRRAFLAEVGSGMLVTGLGPTAALDLGLAVARAEEEPRAISFGGLEPLVALLQETRVEKL